MKKRTQVKKTKQTTAEIDPGLQGVLETLNEAWRDLLIDDRKPAFDEIVHELLHVMNSGTYYIDGITRLLTALWPTANEDERRAASDVAIKAHAKHGRHCISKVA